MSFPFLFLAECYKVMPNTWKAVEWGKKRGETSPMWDAAGNDESVVWGRKEKKDGAKKKWELESNKNQETAWFCLVEPFEYRPAAAGDGVEQVCTSHGITIRKARHCSYSAGVSHCCTHSHRPVSVWEWLGAPCSHYSATVAHSPSWLTILGLVFPLLAYRNRMD